MSPVEEVLVGKGLEGINDRLGLARHQRVDRGSGPTITQRFPALLAASPAPLALLGQSQDLARLGCGPVLAGRIVRQVQQPLLDGCVHSGGNRLVRHQAKPLLSPAPPT